jgi:hypothetical protein
MASVGGEPADKIKRAFKDRYKPFAFALYNGSLLETLDGIDLCNHRLEVLAQQVLRSRPVAKSNPRKW